MECYSFTKPGRLHLKNGEKNQDQLFGIRSRDRIAVCLSDGCSTASHGLAAAQQIVTLTARMFYEQFYDLLLDDPDTVRRKICAVLQPALRAFAEQQGVEQHHRDGFALPAREGEEHGDHQHQRDGHAVRPPRQVGQVAVKDDDGRKEIDEECRQARTHRQPLENHRDDVQRPCDGADGQR